MLRDCKKIHTNLAMAGIDYKKACQALKSAMSPQVGLALGITKTIPQVFSDLRQSFVRLSTSNDDFHINLVLNNSNTLTFHFF